MNSLEEYPGEVTVHQLACHFPSLPIAGLAPVVDAAIDCVGFEAHGHGVGAGDVPATALNDVIGITQVLLSFRQKAAAPALVA